MKRTIGFACLAGFIAVIYLANYAISNWGAAPSFPGGPHTVTLLGLTAPSGVLFVGLGFSLRDGAQMALGKWWILAAISVGAILAYFATSGSVKIALGSALALLIGETADWSAYTPMVERGKVTGAIVLSNTIGAAIDTTVFLAVAFGWVGFTTFFWPQFWLKLIVTIPALLIVIPTRTVIRRRALVNA